MQAKHLSTVPLDKITDGYVELDISIKKEHLSLGKEIKKDGYQVTQSATWGDKQVTVETFQFPLGSYNRHKDFFEQEMALAFRLSFFSDRVVQSYGIVVGRHPSLVREVMGGGDLGSLLYKNPPDLQLCISLAIDIASAVRDVHALGVSHNKVNISSTLLTDQMRAKLVRPVLTPRLKKLFWRMPNSMPTKIGAPPQSSDIYDLGLVFWSLVTHRKPYVRLEARKNESRWLSQTELEDALDKSSCPTNFKRLILDCWSLEILSPADEYRERRKHKAKFFANASESKTTVSSSSNTKQSRNNVYKQSFEQDGFFYPEPVEVIRPKHSATTDWLQALADQEAHPRAQYHLGLLLRDGEGVEEDKIKAEEYFFRAAEQGQGEAQQLLGWLNLPQLVPRLSAADVLNKLLLMQPEKESKAESIPLPVAGPLSSLNLSSYTVGDNKVDCQTGRAILNLAPPGLSRGRKLGAGGFGTVYEASCGGNKRVAVKQLRSSTKHKKKDEAYLKFEQEAALQVRAGLLSEYIVRPYGIVAEPKFQLVMELMSGDLMTLLEKHAKDGTRMSWPDICRVAQCISRGLQDLHRLGVLHRDLKSSNILLTDDDRAKLADLGLADIVVSHEPRKGTPGWRAPECIQEDAVATAASDIYSLGVVLWELATHRKPYIRDGKKISPLLHEELMAALDACPYPAEFKQLVRRCLSLDTCQRPTIDRIVKQIESFLKNLANNRQRQGAPMAALLLDQPSFVPLDQHTPSSSSAQPQAVSVTTKTKKRLAENKTFQQAVWRHERGQYPQALTDLEQAAASYPPACLYMITMCEQKKGVEKDSDKIAFWYKKLEEQSDWFTEDGGDADSSDPKMLFYRGWYYHLRAAKWNQSKAIEHYQQARDDYRRACEYYQRAWEKGYAAAYVNLGDLHQHILEMRPEAAEYYLKAAKPPYAHVTAQYNLALFCHGSLSYTEAATWFFAAAEQGHVGAQFRFALMCRDKIGIAHKPEWTSKSLTWMQRAAEGGHPEAQRLLGWRQNQPKIEKNRQARHEQDQAAGGPEIEVSSSSVSTEGSPPLGVTSVPTSVSTSSSLSSLPGSLESKPVSYGLAAGLWVRGKLEGLPDSVPLIEQQLKKSTPEGAPDLDLLEKEPLENSF